MGCINIFNLKICALRSSISDFNPQSFDPFRSAHKQIIKQSCPTCNSIEEKLLQKVDKFNIKKSQYQRVTNPTHKLHIRNSLNDMKNRITPIYELYNEMCKHPKKINLGF